MKKMIVAAIVALGATGLAGVAEALPCQFGASPIPSGFYSVCLQSYSSTNYGYWYASANNYQFSGPLFAYTGVNAGQSQFNYAGCCSGSSTYAGVYQYSNVPFGYAYAGVYNYNYQYPCCGFAYGGTGAYVGAGPAYVNAGQYSGTSSCNMYVYMPFFGNTQPCGPVPVIPAVPYVPVPL